MAALDTKPVVGAGGGVYIAPYGTAVPTDFAVLDADPFNYLGLISDDGLSYTPPEEETEDMNVWQLQFPWDVVTTGISSSFGFALAQWNRTTVEFAFGGGTFTDEVAPGTTTYYDPPQVGDATKEYLTVLRIKTSSGHEIGVVFPRSKVTEREEVTFNKSEMSTLGVTVTMLGDEEVSPYRLIFDTSGLPVIA